jgi:hypothetical protein
VFLLSHLEMITEILNFLKVPNEQGFFDKDLKPEEYLTDGWQQRVFDEFSGKDEPAPLSEAKTKHRYPREILLFYINHLDWELTKTEQLFIPAA